MNTPAIGFERLERWQVKFEGGVVNADKVIVATHIPMQSSVDFSSITQPRSHLALALRPQIDTELQGMFIAVDEPTHSIRMGRDPEGPLVVVGPRFNTGQGGDIAQRLMDLDDWTRRNLPVAEVVWHWCNEDYDTPDRMAYVGEPDPSTAPGYFIATGFNGWGITNGLPPHGV